MRALFNIVDKLNVAKDKTEFFALDSHIRDKYQTEEPFIYKNWPQDEKNTHQYFIKVENELRRDINKYYNKRYPKIKPKKPVELNLNEEELELYRQIEEDIGLNKEPKMLPPNKNKRIRIHERLVKAFRVPSRMTVRSDSVDENNSHIEQEFL